MRQPALDAAATDWSNDSSPDIAPSEIEGLLVRAELADDPVLQSSLLAEVSKLYEAQGQIAKALDVRLTAFRIAASAEGRADLERLALATGRLAELDALLVEHAQGLAAEASAEAWCDLGRLRLRRLRAPDRALEALDQALASIRSHEALALRAEALEELGRFDELHAALVERAERASSPDEAARVLVHLADVLERRAGDRLGAEEICRRALSLDPANKATLARLEQLVRARGDLPALLLILEDRMALTAPEKQEPLLREAAELCERMGRASEAADYYENLRARHPGELAPLRALERLYTDLGRLRQQVSVLEELVGLVESKREHAVLHRKLAAAWMELGEPAGAIASLEWQVAAEPSEPAFEALTRLYRDEGRFAALADAYTRHLRIADPGRRRSLRVELASVYEQHLHDLGQAIDCWQAVLDEDDRDAEALGALARLYELLEDFASASEMMERSAALVEGGRERSQHLARAAAFTARIDESSRAHRLFQRALDADPGCMPARLALTASHRRRGELAKAEELIVTALAVGDARDNELTGELAALREAEGDLESALAQQLALLQRNPRDAAVRRRAGSLALRLGRHDEALRLATPLPDDGPTELRVERWLLVSRAAHASGNLKLAREAIQRAQELAPDRFEVGKVRAEQLLLDRQFEEARQILVGLEAGRDRLSPADRVALGCLAGECAHERGEREIALARYQEVLGIDPANRLALRKSLDLTVELERWDHSLATLDKLVVLERDPRIRARYRHLAGHMCEEGLGDPDRALAHYQAALSDDVHHPRSAERIEALYRQRNDFAGLAEHCARLIERLGKGGEIARRIRIWSVLAEAAEWLGDRDGSIAALEVVAKLDPNERDVRLHLASLYLQAGPDAADKAILAQHDLLRVDRAHVPTYRALAALYEHIGQLARAEVCGEAASLLATPKRSKERPAGRAELANRPLSPSDWSLLRHPDEDRFLSKLAELVAPLLIATAATPVDGGRHRPGQPVPRNDMRPFVQAIHHVARILELPMPDLFAVEDQAAPMRFVWGNKGKPMVLIGRPLLGESRRMADLVPAVALDLTQLRPERSLRILIHDPSVFALVLKAVIAIAHDEQPEPEAKQTTAALRRWLHPVALDQLGVVGRRLREDGRDLTRMAAQWLRAADLTAARATLVITGDLERTIAAIESRAADEKAARAATLELIWASTTDELWRVRSRLVAEDRSSPHAVGGQAVAGVSFSAR